MLASRFLMALLGATLSFSAAAQGYPDKPVRVVVPFPAGGAAPSGGTPAAYHKADFEQWGKVIATAKIKAN